LAVLLTSFTLKEIFTLEFDGGAIVGWVVVA